MLRNFLAQEKSFAGYVFANVGLAGTHSLLSHVRTFVQQVQPELSFALSVVQIVVGILTIAHIVKKYVEAWKRKHEKKSS